MIDANEVSTIPSEDAIIRVQGKCGLYKNRRCLVNIREFFCGGQKTCDLSRWDDIGTALGVVFIFFLALDVMTTTWSISLGAWEMNRVIAPIVTNLPFFVVVKTGEAVFFIMLARLLNTYIRGAAVWCYGAAVIAALVPVINNVIVLAKIV